jgi:hypothetical protein
MSERNAWQNAHVFRLGLALTFGLVLLIGLLLTMNAIHSPEVALAQGPTIRYVAPSPAGNDGGNDCADSNTPCATVQHAVDVADSGDEIRVATGVYTDVHARPRADIVATGVVTQVVYISKTVTLCGGYTVADWTTSDPEAHPTTLDAQGQGRGLYITGDPSTGSGQAISPTIKGLRIISGTAAGLGGMKRGVSAGGGAYVIRATVTFSDSHVFSNTAVCGGGLYIFNSSGVLLGNNTIHNNGAGSGGGVYFGDSPGAALIANTISENHGGAGAGAGLSFWSSPGATLIANTISENFGARQAAGLYFWKSPDATLVGNIVTDNRGSGGGNYNYGGGLYFESSDNVTLTDNVIRGNFHEQRGGGLRISGCNHIRLIANVISDNSSGRGGGLHVISSTDVELTDNVISDNEAYWGSGACFASSDSVTLTINIITGNHYKLGGPDPDYGGAGLRFEGCTNTNLIGNVIKNNRTANFGGGLRLGSSDITMINNIVADNQAEIAGSGLYIRNSSPLLLHTTIARNSGGDGSGVHIAGTGSTVALTNTILVSHTVGITVAEGNTATLEATLWGTDTWANLADWGGSGTLLTGTINLWGDPAFLDPGVGDYHITLASAAIDKGADAGVTTDIDGDPRPVGSGYDLGADEFALYYVYLPVIRKDREP